MEFIKNLVEKFNAPTTECVGVYISADSKMEVIVYNKDSGEVRKCEKVDVQYDQVQRQVDIAEFASALVTTINSLKPPLNAPVYLSLPNILTSIKTLPSDLEDVEVDIALNSEAEKSYIFKKFEPKISWSLLSTSDHDLTSTYLYSVLQKEQVDQIQQIFSANNLKLVAIDNSFTSLLRGLAVSGLIKENIETGSAWGTVIVSFNNYIITRFQGSEIIDTAEVPIALKSGDNESLYSTISSTISERLGQENLDNLYLVSQTDDFSTETLAERVNLICNIQSIENNMLQGKPLFLSISGESLEPLSLESVGTACWGSTPIDLNFNFGDFESKNEIHGLLGQIGIKKPIHFYLFLIIITAVILIGGTTIACSVVNGFLEGNIQKTLAKINKLKEQDTPTIKAFDINDVKINTYKRNLDLLDSYDSIGATIPENVIIESFVISNDLNATITGRAFEVEELIIYFENLREVGKFTDLKIQTAKIASSDSKIPGSEIGSILPLPSIIKPNCYEFIFSTKTQDEGQGQNNSVINDLPSPVKQMLGQ